MMQRYPLPAPPQDFFDYRRAGQLQGQPDMVRAGGGQLRQMPIFMRPPNLGAQAVFERLPGFSRMGWPPSQGDPGIRPGAPWNHLEDHQTSSGYGGPGGPGWAAQVAAGGPDPYLSEDQLAPGPMPAIPMAPVSAPFRSMEPASQPRSMMKVPPELLRALLLAKLQQAMPVQGPRMLGLM